MALTLNSLFKIQTGGATAAGREQVGSLWMYSTTDAKATVEAANYFNGAAGFLTKGDIILCSTSRGGTPALRALIVTSNNGTTVAIAVQDVA